MIHYAKWTIAGLWIGSFLVGITLASYVLIHEPGVKRTQKRSAEYGIENRRLQHEVENLKQRLVYYEDLYGIDFDSAIDNKPNATNQNPIK